MNDYEFLRQTCIYSALCGDGLSYEALYDNDILQNTNIVNHNDFNEGITYVFILVHTLQHPPQNHQLSLFNACHLLNSRNKDNFVSKLVFMKGKICVLKSKLKNNFFNTPFFSNPLPDQYG